MSLNQKALALGSKRSVIREIFEYGKKRANEIGSENVFDFSLGNPSVNPPEEISRAIIDLVKNENPTLLHGYTSAQGDFGTRKAISDYINERFSAGVTPDFIYMTCGAAASLSISLKALMNEGEECVVCAPFFTEYRVFIENAGGKVVISKPEESTFGLDIKDLESKINFNTKAVIINSPNNPSGVVYSEESILALCEMLKFKSKEFNHPVYLISDEPYRELVYGAEVPYIMNYYDNSVVCYSYSKSLSLPGDRIGYIAVNPEAEESRELYLAVCGAGRSLGYVCAPSLMQQVIKKCVKCKVDVSIYKGNRDILINGLRNLGFTCVNPDGAFYLFVKSPDGDGSAFCEVAKKYDVLLVPCDDFGVEGYVRIAYCVEKSKIERSMPAFMKIAKEYKLIK